MAYGSEDVSLPPVNLTLNDKMNPADVIDVAPVFKWQLPAGRSQAAWHLRLNTAAGVAEKTDVFFDSGWVESEKTAWGYWPPDDARRLTRIFKPYYWSVQIRDADGKISAWSPEQSFILRTGLPPKWTFGIGWSRYNYESSDQVRNVMNMTRKLDIPGDWINPDLAWGGHYDTMKWGSGFADAPAMIKELAAQGYRLGLIDHHGLSAQNDPDRAAFLKQKGWLDGSQKGPGDRVALDLKNPEAVSWYQENYLKPLYQDGVSLFNLDGTCGWGSLWRSRDYRLWDLYHKMFYEAQQKYTCGGNGRGVILARTMSKVYPGVWTDDIAGTWDMFASQIQVLGSLAKEYVAYVTADAGGFNSRMTPEGFVRWSQQALLSPQVWTHDGNEPWCLYGDDALRMFRDAAKLRYRLMPYLYTLAARNYQSGSPIVRSMDVAFPAADIPAEMQRETGTLGLGFFHHYASDQVKGDWKVRLINTQYMLGDDLLVVPVIDPAPWTHPLFENKTAGGKYLATYIEPDISVYDEGFQTCEIYRELVYRIKPLDIPNATIAVGFCALPRWQRDGSALPPMDMTVEGKLVSSVEPLVSPGMRKPFILSFPAKDKNGDGWVEIRIKAADRAPSGLAGGAKIWEQQVAGKAQTKHIFANLIWQYDAGKVSEADLIAGRVKTPFRMNLGVFNQELAGLTASRTFWVPPGSWTDWFTAKRYTGPAVVTGQVPTDRLLLLVREGAVIPLQPDMAFVDQKPVDPLTLVINPGSQNRAYSFYEDDGVSRDHRKGIFSETKVDVESGANGTVIRVAAPQGPYADHLPPQRRFVLEVLGSKPESVEGRNAQGKRLKLKPVYDTARCRSVIDVGKQPGGFEVKLKAK
ncbi:MAG: TIM-barrel domain-containing protein [Kiritimatiellales bacterium]